MIVLDKTTRSLRVVLSGAKTTNDAQCAVVFYDVPSQTKQTFDEYRGALQVQDTNGATPVAICNAPSLNGTIRVIEHISIYNYDTANITAEVHVYDSTGTVTTRLKKNTLGTGTGLVYERNSGWAVL